ncbi:helix-turn-helix transcriptional regulator [Sporosarcina sp. ANT_H38]|uniref:winged helix-turn-helix transcriptional regulator n=1 Tax=Sporosarcina sp. ANT_H38 TaxID=2597358 RepID=UPI0011F0CA4B|nr:helix-turn-helix domain-containing protein [Sporosarcina sp. ANT_H38]KAA0955866.1 helix-turn-helix transcriptional regulator [Sporosarcina sp. ANT_H38]
MNEFELCPRFEKAVSILSQRWTTLILYQLMAGPQRFCTMTDKLGVSGKTLSERLKDLEQQDYVIRNVYPETPVRIEYSLTAKGMSLTPIMKEIEIWSQKWIEREVASPNEKA